MCIASSVPSLGSLPEGMGRAKFRTLKDLYQSTNHQASWPFKSEMEEKPRSCNPCDTWSSSRVHFERVAASVGVGTDCFTNKTYGEKRISRCSSGDGFLFSPSLSASCDCRQRTSSETSNVCSVSSSHNSIFENTESQTTFRVSYSCNDAESLINVRKAQSCGRAGDTSKGFTNFDRHRFSNPLEKHELEISGDNVSCISRSESASLAIGYQNSGQDRKSASCRSASDDSVPEPEKDVNSHFVESNCNHHDFQFFSEEPRLAKVVFPNRSDFLLKDYYNSAISVKGEPSQGSIEQRDSSLGRAAQSRFGCQTYCEKRLPKSIAVIENTSMEKSKQIHQANPIAVSHLMDYEVIVCDICGDAGRKNLLAICNRCSDGAEHTYCMRVILDKLPGGCWMCEECRSECQKSGSPVNLESWGSSGLRSRSSHARKIQTKGTSSASHTRIKRPGVPSETQSAENDRDIKTNAEPPRSSKPCDNAQLDRDLSHKSVKNGKAKPTKGVTSEILISSHPQDKAKAPRAYGNKRGARMSEAELNKKRKVLVETRATLSAASKPTDSQGKCSLLKPGSSKTADLKYKGQLNKGGDLQKRKVDRYPAFHDSRNGKNSGLVSKSAAKLNAKCSEVVLALPAVLNNSGSVKEAKTAKSEKASGLHNSATCLPSKSRVVAEKSENRTISHNHEAPRDLNWLNKRKKNEKWQTEQPSEAASAIKSHELYTDIVCDERSQFDMAVFSKEFVFPMPDCIWLGEFEIRSSNGVVITLAGLQAQLSSRVSQKVLEVVDKIPGVIVVEELPRMRMWPSQFTERQATEDNIALYFFAKDSHSYDTHHRRMVNYMTDNDLALKGNLNGFELLIFSSSVLPKESQRWNKLLFLWGVFRGRKINNSVETPVSNSQKQDKGEIVRRSRAFDLNVCPEDEEDIREIAVFNSIGASSSGVKNVKGKTIMEEKNDADNDASSEENVLKAADILFSMRLVEEKK